MARAAQRASSMTHQELNSGESYRVQFSYGTFSVAAKVTQSGVYYYAVKRVQGKLYKAYVARCGQVTPERLHQVTMRLNWQYEGFGRDNVGREKLPKK